MTVFQDFFVNLDISEPTIIRDEEVEVKAVVFNYNETPVRVQLDLMESDDFHVKQDGQTVFQKGKFTTTVEVPGNGGASTPIWIKPKTLGEIKMTLSGRGVNSQSADAMTKEVLVEPEGEVRYANKPIFIRLDDQNPSMSARIDVAKMFEGIDERNIVEGSRVFQLQAVGDILGPSLSSLGSQIRLPTGCGEQTMVIMGPNVYIYKYLNSSNQLTEELKTKTVSFVQQGYQRELGYQREDGGFSAFGNSDTDSSTWLTTFVMRTFQAAQKHVGTNLDRQPIERAWEFLRRQASKDGLFTEPGKEIHTSMKGGAGSDLNLAAYIYTTAAESNRQLGNYQLTKEKLVEAGRNSRDPYQLALIAYALSIKDADKADGRPVYDRLLSFARQDVDLTYWTPENDQSEIDEYSQKGPTQIETSAYALLTALNYNGVNDKTIQIGRWLMSQRNSLGGFASTQDTVVGLQAISELAAQLRSNGQNFNIDATLNFAGTTDRKTFQVTSDNSRILQSHDPPRAWQLLRSVDLQVSGVGVGLVQLAMKYNVKQPAVLDSGDFNINIARIAKATFLRKRRNAEGVEADLTQDHETILRACIE